MTTQLLDRHLEEALVVRRSREAFRELDAPGFQRAERALRRCRKSLAGQVIWHVNSSPADGVAEILRSLLGYARDGGLDARWLIASQDHELHPLSRRLYNNLYGAPGDGGDLGQSEREQFERVSDTRGAELLEFVRPGDIVYLHDPPVAGLVAGVRDAGAIAIWRCHLGVEDPNQCARRAWDFLRPYVARADAYVFSRADYAWEGLDPAKVSVIRPSIDPFSPKNQPLEPETVSAVLDRIGLTATGVDAIPAFARFDGSPGRIEVSAEIEQDAVIPTEAPVVAQVSGWERLKDQRGVLTAFGELEAAEAHLVIAGPSASALPQESEERHVLGQLCELRASLPADVRHRVHVAQLPIDDRDDNATMVNAIQRRADVVVHKPYREGFGLSVAEAMWKSKPVVASRVGGMDEQIVHGESGILVDDPRDEAGFADAIDRLLVDSERRAALGAAARQRIAQRFTAIDHLAGYLELIQSLQDRRRGPSGGRGSAG